MTEKQQTVQRMAKVICTTPANCYGSLCCSNYCKIRGVCEMLYDANYSNVNETLDKFISMWIHSMAKAKLTKPQAEIIIESIASAYKEMVKEK